MASLTITDKLRIEFAHDIYTTIKKRVPDLPPWVEAHIRLGLFKYTKEVNECIQDYDTISISCYLREYLKNNSDKYIANTKMERRYKGYVYNGVVAFFDKYNIK